MNQTCQHCDQQFHREARKGPTPRYCSDRCRMAASRARRAKKAAETPTYPKVMVERTAWTCRDGKRPTQVDGSPASTRASATWTTYDRVKDQPHGFMLGKGIGCWDLDDCFDTEGKLHGWASEVVEGIDTDKIIWTERSMSGDGLHIFVYAPEAPGRRKDGIEFYSTLRFIATTGDHFDLSAA